MDGVILRRVLGTRPESQCAAVWFTPYRTEWGERGYESVVDFALIRDETREGVERRIAEHREAFNARHPDRFNPHGETFFFWEDGRWTAQAKAVARDLWVTLPLD
jgi:hypothetical protein